MKLTFWGAARTVTGSFHLLELTDGRRIALECGLFQGRRELSREINSHFAVDPASVDAVVLSHAHIDHSGLLPRFWAQGFRGPIYATHATRDLCELMLRDSGHIQEKDADFFNRKVRKKQGGAVEPLYTEHDAEQVMHQFVGMAYDHPFRVLDGVQAIFRDAGHILGSATVMLEVEEGPGLRLGFTGDVGNPGRPILRDPAPMDPVDWLITESTYGGRTHEPIVDARLRLAEVIKKTSARGGKVIVPAFAVGRTQELVHALDHLWNEGHLPPIPVFVDSPLAVNVTGVYRSHPECYDREMMDYILKDPNPFGFERLEYVREAQRSKELNGMRVPMVIISASGMAEAGRILHHLRNNIEDPTSTILIVGFMAEHTLGRKLVDKLPSVNIFGQPHKLRAEVVSMSAFSAHADEPGLLDFIGRMDRTRLKEIFLVHGEPGPQAALTAALNKDGFANVRAPEKGMAFELTRR